VVAVAVEVVVVVAVDAHSGFTPHRAQRDLQAARLPTLPGLQRLLVPFPP
jgi:hypothetical protein